MSRRRGQGGLVDRGDMRSSDYVASAIRTESNRFDAHHITPEKVAAAISLFVAAGRALDALKRGLYYGKPFDDGKFEAALADAQSALSKYGSRAYGGVPQDLPGYSTVPAVSPRIVHAALGLGTESAEILEKVLASFATGKDFDYANLFEELGDGNWYQALAIDAASKEDPSSAAKEAAAPEFIDGRIDLNICTHGGRRWTFEAIWDKNISKLRARYPAKFDSEKAFERDLEAERRALGQ